MASSIHCTVYDPEKLLSEQVKKEDDTWYHSCEISTLGVMIFTPLEINGILFDLSTTRIVMSSTNEEHWWFHVERYDDSSKYSVDIPSDEIDDRLRELWRCTKKNQSFDLPEARKK